MFFYGTLMDKGVLSMVTGLKNPILVPAFLKGFERKYAMHAPFPVLIPSSPERTVDGVVFEIEDNNVINALNRYEGMLYFQEQHTVYYTGDGTDKVFVYMANWNELEPSEEEWTYEKWKTERHRRGA